MKYAIIAAGEGSRLAAEGVRVSKPLVQIQGEHLIDRLLRIFMHNDAEEIVVICNEHSPEVVHHLRALQKTGLHGQPLPLSVVVKSTPSSMHSLYEMASYLEGGPFILTTVDTVFDEAWFGQYVEVFKGRMELNPYVEKDNRFGNPLIDGYMVVTPYEDDEKPLYVETDAELRITGFYDEQPTQPTDGAARRYYISGGIYALHEKALDVLRRCIEQGESRMRNFQRALISEGLHLQAWVADTVLDIDHATDIEKAEAFLSAPRLHLAWRNGRPRLEQGVHDDEILFATAAKLHSYGFEMGQYNVFADLADVPTGMPYRQVVLSMCRDEEELALLHQYEQQGALVVNSTQSVSNCTRGRLDELMRNNHIAMPPQKGDKGYWVKRADVHSLGGADVVYCPNEGTCQEAANRFLQETGTQPVVSAHVEGQLVKFYGVGRHFFRCYTKDEEGVLSPLDATDPTVDALQQEAQRLAALTGTEIWGGDAIFSPHSTSISIIDFNDWPSFSPCCEEAAEAIASHIMQKIEE